jgi:methyl-accepting chemotaxis protein
MNLNVLPELIIPVLTGIVAVLYLIKATTGLERHLKLIALGFFILTAAEALRLHHLFSSSKTLSVYLLTAPFGPLWLAQLAVEFIGIVVFTLWAFKYLFKRLSSQIFIIFTTCLVCIFLITTIGFTSILFNYLQQQSLASLHSNSQVLLLAIDSKKSELLSDLQLLAKNTDLQALLASKNRAGAAAIMVNLLQSKNASSLVALDSNSQVITRAEDPTRYGDSLSSDLLIKSALAGQTPTTITTEPGVLTSTVVIKAAVSIPLAASQSGVLSITYPLDNAFLDSLKKSTSLDTSVYTSGKISATTLKNPDGSTRPIGLPGPTSTVATSGPITVSSRHYLGAFTPLTDLNNNPQGSLFVGSPQSELFATVGRSIEATFIGALILLVLSVIPSYFISRHLASQR